jgi:hypothetical protein
MGTMTKFPNISKLLNFAGEKFYGKHEAGKT